MLLLLAGFIIGFWWWLFVVFGAYPVPVGAFG
jgi:hypothetical protein